MAAQHFNPILGHADSPTVTQAQHDSISSRDSISHSAGACWEAISHLQLRKPGTPNEVAQKRASVSDAKLQTSADKRAIKAAQGHVESLFLRDAQRKKRLEAKRELRQRQLQDDEAKIMRDTVHSSVRKQRPKDVARMAERLSRYSVRELRPQCQEPEPEPEPTVMRHRKKLSESAEQNLVRRLHKDPPKRSQPKSSVRSGHHKPSKQSSQYRHSPPAGSWLSKNLAKPRRLELCKYSFTIPPSSSESPRQRSTELSSSKQKGDLCGNRKVARSPTTQVEHQPNPMDIEISEDRPVGTTLEQKEYFSILEESFELSNILIGRPHLAEMIELAQSQGLYGSALVSASTLGSVSNFLSPRVTRPQSSKSETDLDYHLRSRSAPN